MPIDPALAADAAHLSGALLVGAMIGAQREATPGDHPGLRDFLLIGLAGGVCGLLENPWLSAAALLSIAAVLTVFHFEDRAHRAGITTELAGIATFGLALLASSAQVRLGGSIAIAVSILIAIFLETKQRLQHLLRETISQEEFNATLGFVTVVLVIYPLLPAESFGPYAFFSPRQVWMFVILISSISYAGYFLEKFLGEEKGLVYTAILGGLASTTAATLHLARLSKERPGETLELLRGFLIANSVQFPRAFLIVALVNKDLAIACAWPLALTTLAGIVMAEVAGVLARRAKHPEPVGAARAFESLPHPAGIAIRSFVYRRRFLEQGGHGASGAGSVRWNQPAGRAGGCSHRDRSGVRSAQRASYQRSHGRVRGITGAGFEWRAEAGACGGGRHAGVYLPNHPCVCRMGRSGGCGAGNSTLVNRGL